MKNMIYTMGSVAENGDISINGTYRDGDTENLISVTISGGKISAEILKCENETVLPADVIREICRGGV